MASKISEKAQELVQFCMKKHIAVEFVDYEGKRNVLECTTENGQPTVSLKMGDPENVNLLSELTEFLGVLKNRF